MDWLGIRAGVRRCQPCFSPGIPDEIHATHKTFFSRRTEQSSGGHLFSPLRLSALSRGSRYRNDLLERGNTAVIRV